MGRKGWWARLAFESQKCRVKIPAVPYYPLIAKQERRGTRDGRREVTVAYSSPPIFQCVVAEWEYIC